MVLSHRRITHILFFLHLILTVIARPDISKASDVALSSPSTSTDDNFETLDMSVADDSDDGYKHARNDGEDVEIVGPVSVDLLLKDNDLVFNVCQGFCEGVVKVCYPAVTPFNLDAKSWCGDGPQCGFATRMSVDTLYVLTSADNIASGQKKTDGCQPLRMQKKSTPFFGQEIPSCTPRIIDQTLRIHVIEASPACPLKIRNAQLIKPKEPGGKGGGDPLYPEDTTKSALYYERTTQTEDDSTATVLWIVIGVIVGIILILAVIGILWWICKRNRKNRRSRQSRNAAARAHLKVPGFPAVKSEIVEISPDGENNYPPTAPLMKTKSTSKKSKEPVVQSPASKKSQEPVVPSPSISVEPKVASSSQAPVDQSSKSQGLQESESNVDPSEYQSQKGKSLGRQSGTL